MYKKIYYNMIQLIYLEFNNRTQFSIEYNED